MKIFSYYHNYYTVDNSSRQAEQNNFLLLTVRFSCWYSLRRSDGEILLGSPLAAPFRPGGGFVRSFRFLANADGAGERRDSNKDLAIVEEESLITLVSPDSVSASTPEMSLSDSDKTSGSVSFLPAIVTLSCSLHAHGFCAHVSLYPLRMRNARCSPYFSRIMLNAVKLPILLKIMLAKFI